MAVGPDFMRGMRAGDEDAVDALLRAAFPGPQEADLVRRLRAEARMEMEIVLPWQDGVVGYVGLSRLVAPEGWLALAPVAIAPEWQGRRFGARLVGRVMQLVAIKQQRVVVIGKPSFYARAGFSQARAAGLRLPYSLEYTGYFGPGDDVPEAEVIYPAVFDGV
jgi:putative acetyltransferase